MHQMTNPRCFSLTEDVCLRGGAYTNALVEGIDSELETYRTALLDTEDRILRSREPVSLSLIAYEMEKVCVWRCFVSHDRLFRHIYDAHLFEDGRRRLASYGGCLALLATLDICPRLGLTLSSLE